MQDESNFPMQKNHKELPVPLKTQAYFKQLKLRLKAGFLIAFKEIEEKDSVHFFYKV